MENNSRTEQGRSPRTLGDKRPQAYPVIPYGILGRSQNFINHDKIIRNTSVMTIAIAPYGVY